MKLRKLLPLLFCASLVCTSCNDSDDSTSTTTTTLSIPSSSNYITSYDITTGSLAVLNGADYGLIVNSNQSTLQLVVGNLQYETNTTAISFTLPEIKLTTTQGGYKIDSQTDYSVETATSTATVSNLKMNFVLRSNGNQNLVHLSYVLNNRYEINTIFTNNQFIGTTTSTDLTTPDVDPFTTEDSQYLVVVDGKNMKAQIQIASPQFLSNMPTNLGIMFFDEIPLTFTADGFTFQTNEVIPQINSVPFPAFTITNLKGTIVAGKTMDLTFECAKYNRKVTVAGTAY